MARARELQAALRGTQELQQIVAAMRSLAAARAQEASSAAPSLTRYENAFRTALQRIAPLLPEDPSQPGEHADGSGHHLVLLLGVEHGFVAGYGERVAREAEAALSRADTVLAVAGTRTAAKLRERGVPLRFASPLPSSVRALPEAVEALVQTVDAQLAASTVRSCTLIHAQRAQGEKLTFVMQQLVPLQLSAETFPEGDEGPVMHVAPRALFHELARELVAAQLARGLLDAVCAENAARLAAMEAAHERVGQRIEQLGRELTRIRQDDVTSEIAELVAGAQITARARA